MTCSRRLPVLFALPVLSSLALAQNPSWRPELIGTADPSWSTVWAVEVTDDGVVAGNTYVEGWKRAWIGSAGTGLQLLPLPTTATWSEVNDMNSEGVVVGQVLVDGGASRGIVWRPGVGGYTFELVPADVGGNVPSSATGVNDRGDVVGKLGFLSGSYVWNETDGTLQIPTSTFPETPEDINDQRQIVGGTHRMDLDDLVLEDLGSPTGTSYNYLFSKLLKLNDAGQAVGYAVVATSGWPYLAVRFTDGDEWKLYNSFPTSSASALSISAAGDTVFQLGTAFGTYVNVDGYGSIGLSSLPGDAHANWNLSGSFVPAISRGGTIACNGLDTSTGQAGIVVLTQENFEFLGGAVLGALGDPVLSGYGTLLPNDPARLRLASAAPSSVAFVAWSDLSVPVPLFGGTLYANPVGVLASVPTDALGRFDVTVNWPNVAPGTEFTAQAAVLDLSADFGLSLSNGLWMITQ